MAYTMLDKQGDGGGGRGEKGRAKTSEKECAIPQT